MILSAIAAKLKSRSKDDFKGRHFEAGLFVQAVTWYLRYPLSYRDIEELLLERGLEVDHSTVNRWVLAYAPLIERRLRPFRQPHCGPIRIDGTYVRIGGEWRYLYRAIDKHGKAVDFLLTARRDLDAAKRFFRKMLKDGTLLLPDRIGTDGARVSGSAFRRQGTKRRPVHPERKPRDPFFVALHRALSAHCKAAEPSAQRFCDAAEIHQLRQGNIGDRVCSRSFESRPLVTETRYSEIKPQDAGRMLLQMHR